MRLELEGNRDARPRPVIEWLDGAFGDCRSRAADPSHRPGLRRTEFRYRSKEKPIKGHFEYSTTPGLTRSYYCCRYPRTSIRAGRDGVRE